MRGLRWLIHVKEHLFKFFLVHWINFGFPFKPTIRSKCSCLLLHVPQSFNISCCKCHLMCMSPNSYLPRNLVTPVPACLRPQSLYQSATRNWCNFSRASKKVVPVSFLLAYYKLPNTLPTVPSRTQSCERSGLIRLHAYGILYAIWTGCGVSTSSIRLVPDYRYWLYCNSSLAF